MSWKGFQKGVVRTPQALRQKMDKAHAFKDPIYADTERRFEVIETQTRKLHAESKRYWDAITRMLNHQIEFSTALEQIYQPISGRPLDMDNLEADDGHPEGIAACQQYRALVVELQQLVRPELEMIESRILRPADELLSITKSIKKMLTKRDHKQLDLDRRAQNLKKLQDKPERSVKDEEKMYKAENEYEIALEECNYYNELLRDELPKLFMLEGQFIKPLFQSFYYMQLNIFYTLYMHMEEMKIPYFDLNSDIRDAFYRKRGDVLERTEALPITHFRNTQGKAKVEATRRKFGRTGSGARPGTGTPGTPASPGSFGSDSAPAYDYDDYSPSYSRDSASPPRSYPGEKQEYAPVGRARASSSGSRTSGVSRTSSTSRYADRVHAESELDAVDDREYCRALYDFTAQSSGDLSFKAGDIIEVIERSADTNDWWTGRLNNEKGLFPGNYVRLDV